jgi:hypothetical protein
MRSSPADDRTPFAWLDGIAVAVMVCDRSGLCLYMNEHAAPCSS